MPNLEQLRDAVLKTVQDPSLDTDEVDALINEAIQDVADRVLLPALETSDDVDFVDEAAALLPDNYNHGLFSATIEGERVHIATTMKILTRRFPVPSQAAPGVYGKYVCARGNMLEVRPPLSGTVNIHFYGTSALLALDADIPTCIPVGKQRKLLHAYVCRELFSDIEDGMEGATVNTDKFDRVYERTLVELNKQLKGGQSRPEPIRDVFATRGI